MFQSERVFAGQCSPPYLLLGLHFTLLNLQEVAHWGLTLSGFVILASSYVHQTYCYDDDNEVGCFNHMTVSLVTDMLKR